MLTVHGDTTLAKMDAQLILQVHDELVVEAPEDNAKEVGKRIAMLMSNVTPGGKPLIVPLVTQWSIGYDWGSAH